MQPSLFQQPSHGRYYGEQAQAGLRLQNILQNLPESRMAMSNNNRDVRQHGFCCYNKQLTNLYSFLLAISNI
jgi:hypothetical protein